MQYSGCRASPSSTPALTSTAAGLAPAPMAADRRPAPRAPPPPPPPPPPPAKAPLVATVLAAANLRGSGLPRRSPQIPQWGMRRPQCGQTRPEFTDGVGLSGEAERMTRAPGGFVDCDDGVAVCAKAGGADRTERASLLLLALVLPLPLVLI